MGKFKHLFMLLLIGAMTTMLVGCTNSSNSNDDTTSSPATTEENLETTSEETGEITTLKFGIHVADPETQENVTYKIVEAFNEKYTGQYKVEFEAADTETHSTNMKLEASDGTLPQIFWLNSSDAPEYAEADILLDLSEFLSTYADINGVIDDSAKKAFNNGTIQYGLPYQSNVEGFFYNKSIFKKLGIEELENSTTFEELIEIIGKVNDAGYTPIAQGYMNSRYAVWGYLAMLDRYGYSNYIYDILDGNEKFNNENLVKCFEKLEKLGEIEAFAANMSTQEYFDAKEAFTSGTAAIFNTGAWDSAELDEKMGDTVGFWWGPTFSDSNYNQEASMKVPSAPISVSAAVAEDDVMKEAVYKFLEFYYSEEAATISYAGSVFPATNYTGIEIADTQSALNEVVKAIEDGWTSPAAQPDQILSSPVQNQLYDSIFGVLLGNYTPEEALDLIDKQVKY
jgi:raffinose/stachyose/melibiose transport system substrate-binding protein